VNGRDWFANAFGAAIDDIRKRVIEEPWFGRAVTPLYRPEHSMSDTLGWTQGNERRYSQSLDPAAGHDGSDHAHDFDR
jgi:hypothetical protein